MNKTMPPRWNGPAKGGPTKTFENPVNKPTGKPVAKPAKKPVTNKLGFKKGGMVKGRGKKGC